MLIYANANPVRIDMPIIANEPIRKDQIRMIDQRKVTFLDTQSKRRSDNSLQETGECSVTLTFIYPGWLAKNHSLATGHNARQSDMGRV